VRRLNGLTLNCDEKPHPNPLPYKGEAIRAACMACILPDWDGRVSSRLLSSPESTSKMLFGRDKLEAYLPSGV
jgi:hypothetical protein